ncbi:MAG: sugar transferase, partial [Nitrospirota bacterium]
RFGKLFARLLAEYNYLGYRVFGFLSMDEQDLGKPVRWTDGKVIGGFNDIDRVLENNPIDEVVFAVTDKDTSYLHGALLICEEYGVKMSILPVFFNLRFADLRLEKVGDIKLITFATQKGAPLQRTVKQAIDTLASAVMLLLLSPFMAGIAVAIKLDSRGPVFFVQERCGLNGRVFKFLKFRSMHADAEERKKELLKYNDMSGPIFKMRKDPRVTRVGRWLRKYSFDELPQLINVLKGDMSLVGPRPPVPSEVAKYERWQRRRLSVKPGITCQWQVSGRNSIDFEDWMKLDLKYIDNWSLMQDFDLLLKTIPAVIKGDGM